MSAAEIDICNRALQRIGEPALQSETAPKADRVLRIYRDAAETLLGWRPWSFSLDTVELSKAAAGAADQGYAWRYTLPSGRIGPPRAIYDRLGGDPFTRWRLVGGVLLSDADQLWCEYQLAPEPTDWAPLARQALISLTASRLAFSLQEDAGKAKLLYAEVFDRETGLAVNAARVDAQGKPSQGVMGDGGPLVAARR